MDFNENFNIEKSTQFKQQCLESIIQMMLITKGKLKITESETVDKCEFLIGKDEMIPLDIDEQLFISQYVKQKQISDSFTNKLMNKYHIKMDVVSMSKV